MVSSPNSRAASGALPVPLLKPPGLEPLAAVAYIISRSCTRYLGVTDHVSAVLDRLTLPLTAAPLGLVAGVSTFATIEAPGCVTELAIDASLSSRWQRMPVMRSTRCESFQVTSAKTLQYSAWVRES